MRWIGVDPGKTGGICVLHGDVVDLHIMPVVSFTDAKTQIDIVSILDLFRAEVEKGPCFAMIEKSQAMPGQGGVSNFSYGKTYGILICALSACSVPYEEVHPRTWQKDLFAGMPKSSDTKATALIVANKLFPKVRFLASDRCKKPHDGLVDSCLISEYGRRKYNAKG